jgi:hypothetical protein
MKITNTEINEYIETDFNSRQYMNVNVILTFDNEDNLGDTQDMFNLRIPVNKRDKNAITFFHEKMFKRIVKKCKVIGRNPRDLVKISTCSNWRVFESVTGQESLASLGHSCKWYFGNGRDDLDPWELNLIKLYGFGEDVDMSWVNDQEVRRALGMPPKIKAVS